MADTWGEWLHGTPEQRWRDLERQREELAKINATPMAKQLRSLGDKPVETSRGSYDPREMRMAMVQDQLTPTRTSDAGYYAPAAFDYVTDFGGRMRDTAFTSMAEASKGNYGNAAGLAARSAVAGFVPQAGAGMRGQPDDWRAMAVKNGVNPAAVTAYDLATDPENWVTAPVRAPLNFIVPGVGMRMAGALGRSDDVLRAVSKAADTVRYGTGTPTYLIDEAGETIRRLRGSYAP